MTETKKHQLRTFGWDAVKLSDHSHADLAALREMVVNDPLSASPQHGTGQSTHLYTVAARKKLDALSWAVFYKQQEERRASV